MISTIDELVRTRVAQPAVDAMGLDPAGWSRSAARTASSGFVVSTLGVAAIFATAAMPFASATTVLLGAAHVLSVRMDAHAGRIRRHVPLAAFGRTFQLAETVAAMVFLAFVASRHSPIWTALVATYAMALLLADAVSYVSICDDPPPPSQKRGLTPLPTGA
jgi:uncharacterized integral membrane protein